MNKGKREVWDQQPGESAPAFAAFVCYRDLGSERSIDAVAKKLGKSNQICARWSRKKGWVRRVVAYDSHLDQIMRRGRESELEKRSRHIMTAHEVLEEVSFIALAPLDASIKVKLGAKGKVVQVRMRLTDKLRALDFMGRYHKLWERGIRELDDPEAVLAQLLGIGRKTLPPANPLDVDGELVLDPDTKVGLEKEQ